MSAAREAVLARVREALGSDPEVPEVPRGYRRAGTAVDFDPVARLCERIADYAATVHRVAPDGLEDALGAVCAARGARRLAAPAGVPWSVDGVEVVADEPQLSARALDALDGVLSGCALAIAETGTIVLDGQGASGRRVLTLVPDLHLCVVAAEDVVATVPDAIAALAPTAAQGWPITLVSGPSATSDIELTRVEGVHGPRTLEVFVVGLRP